MCLHGCLESLRATTGPSGSPGVRLSTLGGQGRTGGGSEGLCRGRRRDDGRPHGLHLHRDAGSKHDCESLSAVLRTHLQTERRQQCSLVTAQNFE